jgi:hypothetical protein
MLAVATSSRHIQVVHGVAPVRAVAAVPAGVYRWLEDDTAATLDQWGTAGVAWEEDDTGAVGAACRALGSFEVQWLLQRCPQWL